MLKQPIPEVTNEDVERVAGRSFSPQQQTDVWAILSEYGKESWQCGEDRVRLAVLKLADGDVARLRVEMNRAKLDYHGVIADAEYPGFSLKVATCGLPTDDEHCEHAAHARVAIEDDWRQYQEWLGQ